MQVSSTSGVLADLPVRPFSSNHTQECLTHSITDDASSEQRLYTGVEGEGKEARGDLWGCKVRRLTPLPG